MKRPLATRAVTPGTPDALDSPELEHLRDLPLPKAGDQREGESGRSSSVRRRKSPSIGRGDEVLKYWLGDQVIDGSSSGEESKKSIKSSDVRETLFEGDIQNKEGLATRGQDGVPEGGDHAAHVEPSTAANSSASSARSPLPTTSDAEG
mgnify:FL=1